MWIIGKDSQWNAAKYDPSSLAKSYNVMIQNTSALPESKSLRTQAVIDLSQRYPNMFTSQQVLEMTGLAQAEKFEDVGSAAARCAEDENEYMLDGNGMIEPQPYEDLLVHWKTHTMAIQDIGFKTKTSPEIQQVLIDHITATEMLMSDQSEKNPSFAQMLGTIPQWPMFYSHVSVEQKVEMQKAKEMQAQLQQSQAQDIAASVSIPPPVQ